MTTRIEAHWPDIALEDLVATSQAWAPDAPDELTVNLTLESVPGAPVQATLFGAATLEEGPTRELLQEFTNQAGVAPAIELRTGLPYHHLKHTFADLDPRDLPERALRIRSEFFSRPMSDRTLTSLLTQLGDPSTIGRRQLTFTAMGGAYNRVAEDATAFAHRSERFLLEHIADAAGRPFLGDRPRRRVGPCLPQLPRPRARRLGRGVPRGQLPPPGLGQERLRPAPILRLPPSHLTNGQGET